MPEKFAIRQRVARSGLAIKSVGRRLRVEPFDEYGRRIFTMATAKGPVDVVQGITELTPQWTKVEGISHVWDMRIATSSIPRDTLQKILLKQIDPKNVEHYKKIARFYLQCERYEEARQVLESMLARVSQPDRSEGAIGRAAAGDQAAFGGAAAWRAEAAARRRPAPAGGRAARSSFPAEGVGGEILQGVREMIQEYEIRPSPPPGGDQAAQGPGRAGFPTRSSARTSSRSSTRSPPRSAPTRSTAWRPSCKTPTIRRPTDAEKLSLAISGWLLGTDAATDEAAHGHLGLQGPRPGPRIPQRRRPAPSASGHTSYIKQESGRRAGDGGPVAGPHEAAGRSARAGGRPAGLLRDRGAGPGQGAAGDLLRATAARVRSLSPLSGDRHAQRRGHHARAADRLVGRRPAAKTACAPARPRATATSSSRPPGPRSTRSSTATRPANTPPCSNSLRDACRRFSIDTDRVFLSGHSMGGDAAWDIGLAHPDLWAGVIPIVAQSDRYCTLYWENARYVPFYVVGRRAGRRRS